MKKLLALALLAITSLGTLSAQSDFKPAPYFFIGLQGGGQTTFTNFDQTKIITPTASVSLGAFFTPVVGARIQANGLWNQGGIRPDFKYDYKYVTTDLDLLINLVTLFGHKDYYPLNLYLIGGVGLTTAWDNKDLTSSAYAANLPFAWQKNRQSHNARVGAMLDYNLCKSLSVNLEVSANSLSDRYNSKTNAKDDWQLTAQVGLAWKFGFKKAENKPVQKPVEQPVAQQPAAQPEQKPIAANRATQQPATAAKAEPAKPVKPAVKPELRTEFFYEIRETVISQSEKGKFDQLVKFLKDNPDTKVSVVGYADAGTGNDEINARYARQRAENVAKALKSAGIAANRISTDSKGDDIQPYRENDKNRVVIAVAK